MSSVKVELPKELLSEAHVSTRNASPEIKKMVVLYLYARGNISLAKAAEWLEVSQWEFFELNKTWGLPMHYGVDEYRSDLATIASLPK